MDVKIDSGIPIPGHRGHIKKYPINALAIGESFFVDCKDVGVDKKRAQLGPTIGRAQIDGKKFTCRKFDDGLRIWRTA